MAGLPSGTGTLAVCSALTVAVVVVAGILPRKNPTLLPVVAASLLVLLAGAGMTALRASARTSGPLPMLAARNSTVRLDAVLTGDPRVRVAPGPVRARDLLIVPVGAERVATAKTEYRLRATVLVLGRPYGWTQLLPSSVYARLGRPQRVMTSWRWPTSAAHRRSAHHHLSCND